MKIIKEIKKIIIVQRMIFSKLAIGYIHINIIIYYVNYIELFNIHILNSASIST